MDNLVRQCELSFSGSKEVLMSGRLILLVASALNLGNSVFWHVRKGASAIKDPF